MEMKKGKFKYVMIVTEEDERYDDREFGLSFYADAPWEGRLTAIYFGNTIDDLFCGRDEGLFFQLYDAQNGTRITYGILDPDTPREEIEEYEKTA